MKKLHDKRTDSYSVMAEISVRDYLELAQSAYVNRGGLEGQRDALKTATARRIRERMVDDLCAGAVLPPLVVGIVASENLLDEILKGESKNILKIIPLDVKSSLAIIDGMQRTTALLEASQKNSEILSNIIRVEFWVSRNTHSLVYRMLVLNTGQVPWNLSRQLEVVYSSLIKDIQSSVPEIKKVIREDDTARRINPGEFKSSVLVELYLSFSSRKISLDAKQAVSDQFAKLDFVENLSNHEFQNVFYDVLGFMSELDKSFSRFDPSNAPSARFKKGRNIFDASPARIGFVIAMGLGVLGRPGAGKPLEMQLKSFEDIKVKVRSLISKLNKLNKGELEAFLSLEVLNEVLAIKSGKVGVFERELFIKAFSVLLEDGPALPNLEVCWRNH